MPQIPPVLITAVRDQRAVLFLGSGASRDAIHPTNKSIPLGDDLRDLISDRFLGGALKNRPLVAVSAMASNEAGLSAFQQYIREVFVDFQPADFHKLIPHFRWRAIATTNFDLLIERAYGQVNGLQTLVKSVKDSDGFDERMHQEVSPVGFYKLHGCIDHYTDFEIPMVLGNEQYASYSLYRERFYSRFRDLAYECPVIFSGYSLADPHIQQMVFDLTSPEIKRPQFYCVAPGMDDIEVRYWAQHRVTVIDMTLSAFLSDLDTAIPAASRTLPKALGGGELSIRTHYRVAGARESIGLAAYLAQDATHVHAGLTTESQNAQEFYKGYDRGWGCILQNLDVRRTVVDSVLVDAVLTSEKNDRPSDIFMLKGPAGNGKSVALKRVAWEAAVTYEHLVFYSGGVAGLRFDPIEEIYRLTGKRILLFVDHIALYRFDIKSLLDRCRGSHIPISVFGSERDNEWNIYCENLEPYVSQDFAVRYLSQPEIEQLVGLLDRHQSLGMLRDKSHEERIDAFVSGAERQLLVALHEVTLGLPFEKIVFDEYERIEPPMARRIYLEICALHQFGAPVRAGLISRSSGVSFQQFGTEFLAPLDKVVLVEEDRHTHDLSYLSRHPHVASMVFFQALPTAEEKYDLLASMIDNINTDYSSDRETFGRMMKGRGIAEILPNVDLGRLLYDRAEASAPRDAFIPHQRAVFEMAHPGGALALAEDAAARAYALNPRNNSIQHTQAEIARRQANEASDPLRKSALRRFTRQKIGREANKLSEFDLHTRARLALDELKEDLSAVGKITDRALPSHILEAARDAENAISRGLQMFPESSLLLSAEAAYRDLFDQKKEAVAALRKAFTKNPRQDWLAIRLARRYSDDGNYGEAFIVLDTCLKDNPSSKLVHLEYARILERSGGTRSLILDHLRRSFTDGDNNFEAQFWYGRELFLQGSYPESKTVFERLNQRAPGRFRTRSAALVERSVGESTLFGGTVQRLEEGYAFLEMDHLQSALFSSRGDSEDTEWQQLSRGRRLQASIGFNRKGARAVNVTAA